ncbi:MAG: HAMP domain-containing protein, partial [Brevundimonas sp.]
MTDTAPFKATGKELLAWGASAWRDLVGDRRGRTFFGIAYGLAVLITAAAIWLVAVAPAAVGAGSRDIAGRILLLVLVANLGLIAVLAAFAGRRVLLLARERKEAGARLHLRFVTLFSAVALIPSVLIALVFGVLVNRGVDQWFSDNVSDAVQNGADVGKAYIRDVSRSMDADMVTIADQLEGARPIFNNRIQFSDALVQVAEIFDYPAIYVLNGRGEVLAQGERAGAPPYRAPPASMMEVASEGGAPPQDVTERPDAVRSLYLLRGYGDAYLYVVRPLQPGLIASMKNSDQSIQAYKAAEESRGRLQAAFALSYLETALLVLVGAVWLGMSAANAIAAPVGRLVSAANQVAAGDLTVRVDTAREPGEIAMLSHAFNHMTSDLQAQQTALRDASEEATARSRFIETVLSGVSAGVIGLDRQGRISIINDSALTLLAIDQQQDVVGKKLGKVSPELSDLAGRAEAHIEEDVDVSRAGETRRLRVRIEGGLGGEMVMTFDDITRLVTAQRNAAWRDVA